MPAGKTDGRNGISNEKSIGWFDNMSGKEMFTTTVSVLFRCAKTAPRNSLLAV
jgi:hypothetical protein